MKKKLVLMLVLGVSMVPSVLFATTGEMGRPKGSALACGDTPAFQKTLPERTGQIQAQHPQGVFNTNAALDGPGSLQNVQ